MINAGLEISGFNGLQRFDDQEKLFLGIAVKVNYPPGQNSIDNPIQPGDIAIEPDGKVWEVVNAEVTSESQSTFRIEIRLADRETTEEDMPGLGEVARGAIVTPKEGFVAPFWDTQYVQAEVGRIANIVTADNFSKMITGDIWSGRVDLGEM